MIGIVCGLASEARIVERALRGAATVAISGASPEKAREEATRLTEAGAEVLWSIGIAGGLAPELRPGRLVLASQVVCPDDTVVDASPEIITRAGEVLWPTGRVAIIAGSDTIVATPKEKAALRHHTQAHAVDMESHSVAQVAADAAIGFGALRAVADSADMSLPELATDAVDAEGRPLIGEVLTSLGRRPGDLPGLITLASASRTAHSALRRGMLALNAAGVFSS